MSLPQIYDLIWQPRQPVLVSPIFYLTILLLIGVPTSGLLIWRLWRFTLYPLLHPSEPKELPYWVPYLGHAIQFIKDQDTLLNYGRNYFQDTREPFAITLGGEKLYILTSYRDATTAYKNTTTLDYGGVIRDLVGSFGISELGAEKIYAPIPAFTGEIERLNPQAKSLFHLKSDFYHIQLQQSEQLTIIQDKFLTYINEGMRIENLPEKALISGSEAKATANFSLYKLVQRIFVKAGIRAFFGERMLDLDSSLVDDFICFDDNNWMIWYKWPQASDARDPMARVLKTMERYLRLPKSERPGAAWLVTRMEEAQRQLGTKESDIAIVLLMFMWV
jgi:hypothetical protein